MVTRSHKVTISWCTCDPAGIAFDPRYFAIWFLRLVPTLIEVGLIVPHVDPTLFVIHGMAGDVPKAHPIECALPFVPSDVPSVIMLIVFPIISPGQVPLLH